MGEADMSEYSVQIAPLRGDKIYRLEGQILSAMDGNGLSEWQCDLATVTGMDYAVMGAGPMVTRKISLMTTATRQVIETTAARTDSVLEFKYLSTEVATVISRISPDMTVAYGVKGRAGLAMFATGVFSCLLGGGLLIAMAVTGVDSDVMLATAPATLGLLALGGYIGYAFWPWRQPTQISMDAFAAFMKVK